MRFVSSVPRLFLFLILSSSLLGCDAIKDFFAPKDPEDRRGSSVKSSDDDVEVAEVTESNERGAVASFKANSKTKQKVSAPKGSSAEGAEAEISPGSLSVDAEVSVIEGAPLNIPEVYAAVDLEQDSEVSAGKPIAVVASNDASLAQPMSISLPVPEETGFWLGGSSNVIVLFHSKSKDGSGSVGIMPSASVTVSGNTAKIEVTEFGIYQAVRVTVVVEVRKAVPVTYPPTVVRSTYNTDERAELARALGAVEATSLSHVAAKPNESVTITGKFLHAALKLTIDSTAVDIKLSNFSTATFVMPSVRAGLVKAVIKDGSKEIKSFDLVSDSATDGVPVWIGEASQFCAGVQYRNGEGALTTGTRDCTVPANCASDGAVDCVTTSAYPAVDMAHAVATNIVSGTTIAGVSGSMTAPPADCNSNFQTACVATTSFKAVDPTNLVAANIKNGVAIAGLTGTYPSSSNTLANADGGTADLDLATFDAKLKSTNTFEWFSADGTRYTNTGDADLGDDTKIKTGVSIFGTVGQYTGVSASDAWNIRAGSSLGGVSGKLKTNCRNGVALSTYDMGGLPRNVTPNSTIDTFTSTSHGFALNDQVRLTASTAPTGLNTTTSYYVVNVSTNAFSLSTTSGGSVIDFTANGSVVVVYPAPNASKDYWDTIDDYNNAGAIISVFPDANLAGSTWTANNFCGGKDTQGTTADDDNVWKDVSVQTSNTSVTESCASTSDCVFEDKISGLRWSKLQSTSATWPTAMAGCDGLTFAGQSDWRLPTQKELMDGYNHGIRSAGTSYWVTTAQTYASFWSSSSGSDLTNYAWYVDLAHGGTNLNSKTATVSFVCVR